MPESVLHSAWIEFGICQLSILRLKGSIVIGDGGGLSLALRWSGRVTDGEDIFICRFDASCQIRLQMLLRVGKRGACDRDNVVVLIEG